MFFTLFLKKNQRIWKLKGLKISMKRFIIKEHPPPP